MGVVVSWSTDALNCRAPYSRLCSTHSLVFCTHLVRLYEQLRVHENPLLHLLHFYKGSDTRNARRRPFCKLLVDFYHIFVNI